MPERALPSLVRGRWRVIRDGGVMGEGSSSPLRQRKTLTPPAARGEGRGLRREGVAVPLDRKLRHAERARASDARSRRGSRARRTAPSRAIRRARRSGRTERPWPAPSPGSRRGSCRRTTASGSRRARRRACAGRRGGRTSDRRARIADQGARRRPLGRGVDDRDVAIVARHDRNSEFLPPRPGELPVASAPDAAFQFTHCSTSASETRTGGALAAGIAGGER